jgi:uncharacterized repeat protein (TIGR01451 family)
MLALSQPSEAALLGLTPAEPTIDFGASGVIDYNATTGVVTVSAIPSTLLRSDPFLFGTILGASGDDEALVTIQFKVSNTGQLISGVDGADLIVKGSVDIDFDGTADYDGILLQAEITQFGFENGAAGDDFFDLRLVNVAGLLSGYVGGQDAAVRVVSESSTEFPTPFNGSFAVDFEGTAKGVVGTATPAVTPSCSLKVETACSTGGSAYRSKCRIKVTKSHKHWEFVDRHDCKGNLYRKAKYGSHGDSVPSWSNRYPGTNVTFRYVLTNTGTTPVSNIIVDDAFDTPVAGVPAVLNPGQSVTLSRTEALHEKLDNVVLVNGLYQTAQCSATDTVVIKDMLRDRRRHDFDDFRDKGRGDNSNWR